MDNTYIALLIKSSAILFLIALAGGEAFAISLSFNQASAPVIYKQDVEFIWRHISGPLGVLFAELLSILVLAKVLHLIYRQKEKITQKLLEDKDKQIEKLDARVEELLGIIDSRWK